MKITFHRFTEYPDTWGNSHLFFKENEAAVVITFASRRSVELLRRLAHFIKGIPYRPYRKMAEKIERAEPITLHMSEDQINEWVEKNRLYAKTGEEFFNLNGLLLKRDNHGCWKAERDDSNLKYQPPHA